MKAGLSEVERREDVDPVAATRARGLSEKFSHTRPYGEGYMSLMDEYVVGMISMWMNSEGYKKNLLNPKHTGLGIGVYQVGQMVYCSQMFVY